VYQHLSSAGAPLDRYEPISAVNLKSPCWLSGVPWNAQGSVLAAVQTYTFCKEALPA